MEVVLSLFPNAEGIFAVEDNKKDCVEKLKEAIAGKSRMSVKVLETKYPQGAERQLIYATTKRAIHAAMLPADAGCIVDNVETLIAINQAVRFGKPLMERVVTVSGDDIQNPGNFRVPIGMNHRELVDAAGGFITEPQKLISGGPMMGFAMVTLDAPVTKTSSSILAFQKDEAAEAKETCLHQLRTLCGSMSEQDHSFQTGRSFRASQRRRICEDERTGMCGMWFLQFCLSGKKKSKTGDRFYEKDCTGKQKKVRK